jgi:phage gp45-like
MFWIGVCSHLQVEHAQLGPGDTAIYMHLGLPLNLGTENRENTQRAGKYTCVCVRK